MVIFRSPDGKPGYHQAETLDEAVAFVERLRNQDGVSDARVFRMEEVAIEFKVYYRVEVAGDGPAEQPAEQAATPLESPDAASTPAAPDADVTAPGDDELAGNGAGNPGRFGLFSRA